jgi:type I restriction enzyme R subunit
MSKEAQARLRINKLLEESEWVLVDTSTQRCNVKVEMKTDTTNSRGFVDYVLMDDKGFPLVVVEAKNEDKDPLIGKEQARTYAKSIHARLHFKFSYVDNLGFHHCCRCSSPFVDIDLIYHL